MIHAEELRIGNLLFWKPGFSNSNLFIQVEITSVLQEKVAYTRSHLEHRVEPFEDDKIANEISYTSYKELIPIPLTEFQDKLDKKIKYPGWIQFVHELQNWYYWNNGKRELELP